ncbi:MAG: hypothetical protein V4819_20170 [Verrucomicrobiota bacterium]
MNPDPLLPDPELLIKSMKHVSLLEKHTHYTIDLMVCGLDLNLYARLDVDEDDFYTGDGFSMSDYVPISAADLVDLKELSSCSMLRHIQTISKGRHCIVTSRWEAAWVERVFYPHT